MNVYLKYSLIGAGVIVGGYGAYRGYQWYQARKSAQRGESKKEESGGAGGGGTVDELKKDAIVTPVAYIMSGLGLAHKPPIAKSPPPSSSTGTIKPMVAPAPLVVAPPLTFKPPAKMPFKMPVVGKTIAPKIIPSPGVLTLGAEGFQYEIN